MFIAEPALSLPTLPGPKPLVGPVPSIPRGSKEREDEKDKNGFSNRLYHLCFPSARPYVELNARYFHSGELNINFVMHS